MNEPIVRAMFSTGRIVDLPAAVFARAVADAYKDMPWSTTPVFDVYRQALNNDKILIERANNTAWADLDVVVASPFSINLAAEWPTAKKWVVR